MKKIMLLILMSVFSVGALAATPLIMGVQPTKPLVLTANATINPGGSDERTLTAPWFAVKFVVYNNGSDSVTLTNFKVTATSPDGVATVMNIAPDQAPTIKTNETYKQNMYVDGLDPSTTYKYQILVEVSGYIGDTRAPLDPTQFKFITN